MRYFSTINSFLFRNFSMSNRNDQQLNDIPNLKSAVCKHQAARKHGVKFGASEEKKLQSINKTSKNRKSNDIPFRGIFLSGKWCE